MAEIKILIKNDEIEEKDEMKQFINSLNYERKIYLKGFLNGILSNIEREGIKENAVRRK